MCVASHEMTYTHSLLVDKKSKVGDYEEAHEGSQAHCGALLQAPSGDVETLSHQKHEEHCDDRAHAQ